MNTRIRCTILTLLLTSLLIGGYMYLFSDGLSSHTNRQLMTEDILKTPADSGPPRPNRLPTSSVLPELNVLPRLNVSMIKNCDAYNELRDVDFTHSSLKDRICINSSLYATNSDGRFPLCLLQTELPTGFYDVVKKTAKVATMKRALGDHKPMSIFTFSEQDEISRLMLQEKRYWEDGEIVEILTLLKKFPTDSITYLDVGSNLGLYSLQARELGYTVLALDANIRTLIRLQMTAKTMGILDDRLKLFWCFVDEEVGTKKMHWVGLNFGCHIGGASSGSTNWRFANPKLDTIPVMTARTDDLRQYIKTKKVFIKIDIESGEHMFLKTGVKLFQEFDVAVMQMEFWRNLGEAPQNSPYFKFVTEFMLSRGYKLVPMGSKRVQEKMEDFRGWDGMWIKEKYLKLLLN